MSVDGAQTGGVLTLIGDTFRAPGRKFRRFVRDASGTAAVEFAYLVPVILLILMGTIEISRAVMINRRFALATSMVADLIGREEKMTSADITAIYKIVDQIMSPYSATSLKVSIVPVKASPSNASLTKVYAATTNRPSYHGGTQPAKCASYALTSGLVAKGASVIVVETQYSFSTLFGTYIIGSSNWTNKAIVNPRNSCVDFDNDNCVSTCF